MKWSWKLGRFAGIDVYIHSTFFLLLGWMGLSYWLETRTLAGTLEGIGFLLALFGVVVLHEYGHALTARRYNIQTRDITLLPIGGVARLERMPDKPRQELWVALAGPAVNVVIAAVLFVWLLSTQALIPLTGISMTGGPFIERLMTVNLFLAGFNLLPAFPMDGGRVLRALLAMRTDYVRATQVAASVGQGMALLFGIAGLFGNPLLLFIAFFVWIGARQEANMVMMRSTLNRHPFWQAMPPRYRVISPYDEPHQAASYGLEDSQQQRLFILDDGRVVGMMGRE